MKMRKFAAVLLAIVLLCAAVPNVAFAQSGETMGNAININLNETVSAERYYCYYKFTIDRPGYIQLKVDIAIMEESFFALCFKAKHLTLWNTSGINFIICTPGKRQKRLQAQKWA